MEEKKEPRLVNADKVLAILATLRLRELQDKRGNKHYQQGTISGLDIAKHVVLTTLMGTEGCFGALTELERLGYQAGLMEGEEHRAILLKTIKAKDMAIECLERENKTLKKKVEEQIELIRSLMSE